MSDDELIEDEDFDDTPAKETVVRRCKSLTRADLLTLSDSLIQELCEVVPVSEDAAFVLLSRQNWDVVKVQTSWWNSTPADSASLWWTSGDTSFSSKETLPGICSMCLEFVKILVPVPCGHSACSSCWTGYLSVKVLEGLEIVNCRCFGFKCVSVLPRSFIRKSLPAHFVGKFDHWCVNDFVARNESLVWCPSCELAVLTAGQSVSLTCSCGTAFCSRCGEEPHMPANCEETKLWNEKNSSESENVGWILANTKPCPVCRKPIEKNQGCNHMRCRGGCEAEFCWMCLQLWKMHGTGNFYTCNIYKESNEDKLRKESKQVLDRYMFFYSRFMNHEKGRNLAKKSLAEIVPFQINFLSRKFNLPITDLECISIAWTRVIECRQVLKWTYVSAFYRKPCSLNEYLQQNLEEITDRLHEVVEKDLAPYFPSEEEPTETLDVNAFLELRSRIVNYSDVTANFCHKISLQFS